VTRLKFALLILIALAAPLFAGSAKAAVYTYAITFNDPDGAGVLTGGSGLMTLDVANFPGPFLYGTGNPNFLGLTATINGQTYIVNASDIVGGINVGAAGQFYDLGVKTQAGLTPGSHYFEMFGAQGYAGYNVFTVGGPNLISQASWSIGEGVIQVAAVPEISTWAMMLLGFAGIAFMAHRRTSKRSVHPA
jgi:hypothetical protein